MPIKTAKQFGLMMAASYGKSTHPAGPSKEVAREFIEKTPKKKRKFFAKQLTEKRKNKNDRN